MISRLLTHLVETKALTATEVIAFMIDYISRKLWDVLLTHTNYHISNKIFTQLSCALFCIGDIITSLWLLRILNLFPDWFTGNSTVLPVQSVFIGDIHGLLQERHNSSALAMELCLSCTNPLILYIHNHNTANWLHNSGDVLNVCKRGPL